MMSRLLASAYRVMDKPFAVEFHPRRPLVAGVDGGAEPDSVMRDALARGRVLFEAAA